MNEHPQKNRYGQIYQHLDENEKRYLPRWNVRNRVKFSLQSGNDIDECQTTDLSCSGACLRLSRSLIPGQTLKMKIYLDKSNAVEVNGRVVWNRIAQDARYAGIAFERPPIEVHETILNYAFELDQKDVVNHWFSGWKK